jgi:alpha-mannosidase
MAKIHLVCNAHLDPVWLWRWEEGAAEAVSTFRTAAGICEENDGFVFNHNEVVLYKWIEEYEPALFRKIQSLVKRDRWHIMGGWFLQPDCNMPSGESFVRQILAGRKYFREKFGSTPTTAISFDPFGHTRGLVQIMAKSGFDSYIFGRPRVFEAEYPAEEFRWIGYDGSEVVAARIHGGYGTEWGKARQRVEEYMAKFPGKNPGLVLWGVGNHGGGPSRADVRDLNALMKVSAGKIIHSTPEAYFKDLKRSGAALPEWKESLRPSFVGCYSSMITIKQTHRRLENELYSAENMSAAAAFQGLAVYPAAELGEAAEDLMFGEFHDILPGSSIQPVEEDAKRRLAHGLEIVSRVKTRMFFKLASGSPVAAPGEIPVFVYNHHPHDLDDVVSCEVQPEQALGMEGVMEADLFRNGRRVSAQVEKEYSNVLCNWRTKVVFRDRLAAGEMRRYECRLTLRKRPKPYSLREKSGRFRFKTKSLDVLINAKTGFVDRYRADGADYVKKGAFQPLVMADLDDSWVYKDRKFDKVAGKFKLMNARTGTAFSGISKGTPPSVRVIEDGDVRTVVEALFEYGKSSICQRYFLPKKGTELGVEIRVFWNEKSRMLKMQVPLRFDEAKYLGQTAYGVDELSADGSESVAQKWVAVVSEEKNAAFTCLNDGTYASDYSRRGLRLTLLRSPAYSAHFLEEGRPLVRQDRFVERMDQGERLFRFYFNAGESRKRLELVETEANAKNQQPFALGFFPPGTGRKPAPGVKISGGVVQLGCMKKAENSNDLILRLFEPTGKKRSINISVPFLKFNQRVEIGGYEIKTLKINPRTGKMVEVNLLER